MAIKHPVQTAWWRRRRSLRGPRRIGALVLLAYVGAASAQASSGPSGQVPRSYQPPPPASQVSPSDVGSAELQVTASAVPTELSAGETVFFTALVENPPPGEQLGYSWSFGDGAIASGAAPSHAYRVDGDYPATVTVSAGHGASGQAAVVVVHVGRPPRRSSGSGLGSADVPGGGTGGQGSGKGGSGGGSDAVGQAAPRPRPRARPKPPARRPARPAQPAGTVAKSALAPPAADDSRAVRGVLLADVGPPIDLRLLPPPPSGSPGALHRSRGGASGLGPVLGGLALALAIATLGGLTERRRARPRLA